MKTNNKYPSDTIHLIKRILILLGIILIVFGTGFLVAKADKAFKDFEKSLNERKLKELNEIEKQKKEDTILDCLAEIETNNRNIKVIDSNNKISIGVYQFQLSTLKDIYPTLNNNELQAIALDPIQAKEIARTLLFEKGEWWRWGNSIRKMFQGKCKHLDFEPDLLNSYLNEIGIYANI